MSINLSRAANKCKEVLSMDGTTFKPVLNDFMSFQQYFYEWFPKENAPNLVTWIQLKLVFILDSISIFVVFTSRTTLTKLININDGFPVNLSTFSVSFIVLCQLLNKKEFWSLLSRISVFQNRKLRFRAFTNNDLRK